MKAAPPGWEPHQIARRVDGWVIDPDNDACIPAEIAAMIVEAMPQPGGRGVVAVIRARMIARQHAHERKNKMRIARQRIFDRMKQVDHE